MGPLTPIIGLRLLALAAGLRHNAEIGQPGLCFSAYGHKFGINHLAPTEPVFAGHDGDRRVISVACTSAPGPGLWAPLDRTPVGAGPRSRDEGARRTGARRRL